MKVLIAIDDSPFSTAVIEAASESIWAEGTSFLVLNVVAVPTKEHWQDWGLPLDPDVEIRLTREATTLVEDAVSYLKPQLGKGTDIHYKLLQGHAAESIVAEARAWHADLIMLGAHGFRGLKHLLIGSVAEQVLLNAPCTVEIVRSKHQSESHKHQARKQKTTVL